jgi:RimJ/RimL family protein N-acetyltransferase
VPANANDCTRLAATLDAVADRGLLTELDTLHLDRGYGYAFIRAECTTRGLTDVRIPPVRRKGKGRHRQPVPLGLCWPVERTNSWLSNFGQPISGRTAAKAGRCFRMLSDHWPLFDLRLRTERLELRYPNDADCAWLADLAREPVHEADFMPFTTPWTRTPSPLREQNALRHWWQLRASLSPEAWNLPFIVYADGEPVGCQNLQGTHFAVTRSVLTGSWLVQRRQGEGIGKAMRAAVLHLAFAGLGAAEARTSAFEDNPKSLGVTKALGYGPNGSQIDDREGKPVRHLNFLLHRADWERRARLDVTIENLAPCLALLGLDNDPKADS